MKKTLLLCALAISSICHAKKVKFAVDMTGQTINATGMHVTGDFQTAAGFGGGDWQAGTTSITQEPGTDIYSIVVDIPAFQKYEYKFVNGDQFYDVEVVAEQSRVGYNFNDNRWIYIDSLADDTTFVGALMWGANAPSGLNLIRFKVDMKVQGTVSASGVHVAGSFQGWDPSALRMYSFQDSVYEYMDYLPIGSYEYHYYNGNTSADFETVPSSCAMNNHRGLALVSDTVISTVCFSSCAACVTTGIATTTGATKTSVYPNPASGAFNIEFNDLSTVHNVYLSDVSGRTCFSVSNYAGKKLRIETNGFSAGVYLARIQDGNGKSSVSRLVIQ